MTERRPDRIVGGPHDEFWAFCDERRLCVQACRTCSRLLWPVAEMCPYCGGTTFDWQELSGYGKLASWCRFERRYYGDLLPTPWDTILVELEEGPLFVSNPLGFTTDEASIDLPVEVAFLDCEDGFGPFRLPVFRAVGADHD